MWMTQRWRLRIRLLGHQRAAVAVGSSDEGCGHVIAEERDVGHAAVHYRRVSDFDGAAAAADDFEFPDE